jgi:hypothetical protein
MSKPATARVTTDAPSASTPTPTARRYGKRKVTDGRRRFVAVRCNDPEYATMTAAAAQAGLSVGAYLRSLALGDAGRRARRQPGTDHAALVRVLGLLGNYGGNLNQLAHVANASGALPTEAALIEIAHHVRELGGAVMQALGRGD